jgi:hypothetical protein
MVRWFARELMLQIGIRCRHTVFDCDTISAGSGNDDDFSDSINT